VSKSKTSNEHLVLEGEECAGVTHPAQNAN